MMSSQHLLVDLSKDCSLVVDRLCLPPDGPIDRHATSLAKASSVPGITHTASPKSSAAAKPRVPVPKSRVTSLSPTFAGRERTAWRLKSHISRFPLLEAPSAQEDISGLVVPPHHKKIRWRSCRSSGLWVSVTLVRLDCPRRRVCNARIYERMRRVFLPKQSSSASRAPGRLYKSFKIIPTSSQPTGAKCQR